MDCRKGIVADQKYVLQSQIQSEVINSTTHQRRSANYKPNIWKYDLLQSLTIQYNEEECKRQVEKLKEDVMCMFIEAVDLVAKLEFIDSIEKLGLANLFEVEIKEALDTIVAFKNNHPITEEGIYANALFFRILRQHGFNVSQDIFRGFTSKMGTFMKSTNSDDTKAMLELLEASHLALEGENILIEAKEFSAGILKNIINSNVEDKVAKQLAQALELPLQWRAQWYDVKRHIHELENKDNTNSVLLKLAKLNFNMVQATHQNDLKEISSLLQAIQKNHIAHKRVLELRKTTRQAMAKANAKNTELEESKKQIAELQTEMACLNGLVSSAEADKRKATAVVKDKYLRELAKLKGKKDAEIKELEKKLEDAENRGYKEGKATYMLQCEAAKDLFFKCGWKATTEQLGHGPETEVFLNPPSYFIPSCMAEYAAAIQQKFLEAEDDEEETVPNNAPVVDDSAIQPVQVEPTVEDLTTELRVKTGLRVKLDADLDDLFS